MVSVQTSLTGSERGAPASHRAPVCDALGRLRFGVLLCCWVIGASLLTQTVVFALTSFTDLRWSEPTVEEPKKLVVNSGPIRGRALRSALDDPAPDESATAVNPNRIRSRFDRIFAVTAALARGLGLLSVLALLPLITVGVLLATASATQGVDRTVSAFSWAIVLGLIALPLGGLFGLPWQDGALWTYSDLTAHVDYHAGADLVAAASAGEHGAVTIFARYLMLPLAGVAAVALVGFRFDSGVAAGLFVRENLALDPTLEKEAGNVKAGTLHGGRTASAMHSSLAPSPTPAPAQTASVTQLTKGEAPRRLI